MEVISSKARESSENYVLTPNNGMSTPGFRELPGTFENDNLYLDRYGEVIFQTWCRFGSDFVS